MVGGGGQSLGDIFPLKSIFFIDSPYIVYRYLRLRVTPQKIVPIQYHFGGPGPWPCLDAPPIVYLLLLAYTRLLLVCILGSSYCILGSSYCILYQAPPTVYSATSTAYYGTGDDFFFGGGHSYFLGVSNDLSEEKKRYPKSTAYYFFVSENSQRAFLTKISSFRLLCYLYCISTSGLKLV